MNNALERIYDELLQTERNYNLKLQNLCSALDILAITIPSDQIQIKEHLKREHQAYKRILHVSTLMLAIFNQFFSKKYNIAVNPAERGRLLDTLNQSLFYLTLYTPIILNYDDSIRIFNQIRQNTQLNFYLTLMEKDNSTLLTNLKIESHLILPVQRIPRYELFLKDLLKHTPITNPECPSLIEVHQKIQYH